MLVLTGGCSDATDPPPPVMRTVSGVVETGDLIAGATVFADIDGDNVLGDDEISTTTDATGHFTLSYLEPVNVPHSPDAVAHAIGAIITADNTRVGVDGPNNTVGIDIRMRAPATDTTVVSPLSTMEESYLDVFLDDPHNGASDFLDSPILYSEMRFDIHDPAPLLLTDYVTDSTAGTATSTDSARLRLIATALAGTISVIVDHLDAAQPDTDFYSNPYYQHTLFALDDHVDDLSTGVYYFAHLTPEEQQDIITNGADYADRFIDLDALRDALKSALEEGAIHLEAEAIQYLEDVFIEEMKDKLITAIASEVSAVALEIALEAI
jgi:hypothetical protein